MNIEKNKSLKSYNTFGIDVNAEAFARIQSLDDLQEARALGIQPMLVLGGGSNLLLTQSLKGLLLKNDIKGIEVIRDYKKSVHIRVGGGEVWHRLVLWCIERGYGGIENLSLIPGTVGAAPIQNIGAYGVELTQVFHKLEAVHLETGTVQTFTHEQCQFGYRDSVFKRDLKGQYCICYVQLKLSKIPRLNLSYGAIGKTLAEMGVRRPGIKTVSQAVIRIRSSKLPDPAQLGNSGSFFKNPEISQEQFEQLQRKFPNLVSYPLPEARYKIPAGWLIEQCGWKGKRVGNTGSHTKQALVLVNYGGAKGAEVWALAQEIIQSVKAKFGIQLSPEVNVW